MLILSMDTTTPELFVVLAEDGLVLASRRTSGQTHMTTLMPSLDEVLEEAGKSLDQVDYFACCVGPGSYTGIRIGVAAAQALAVSENKACLALDTLDVIAYEDKPGLERVKVPLLDARNRRVYTKAFLGDEVLIPTGVYGVDDFFPALEQALKEKGMAEATVTLMGDEASGIYAEDRALQEKIKLHLEASDRTYYVPEQMAQVAEQAARQGLGLDPAELLPRYYQKTQAERERLEKTDHDRA
jgi:tRNA threonylcarbamoyladenosine biosynthesis protein TsaB